MIVLLQIYINSVYKWTKRGRPAVWLCVQHVCLNWQTIKYTMRTMLEKIITHFKFTGSTAAGPCTGPVHSWEEPPAGLLWQGPWLPAVPALGHPEVRVHLCQSGPSERSRAQRRRGGSDGQGSCICIQRSVYRPLVWYLSISWLNSYSCRSGIAGRISKSVVCTQKLKYHKIHEVMCIDRIINFPKWNDNIIR